jgi:cytochrome b
MSRPIDAVAPVTVWDPLVRVFHWSLAGSVAVAWLTGDHGPKLVHHWAGYVAAALIAVRLVWGVIGTRHARFSAFVRHPRAVLGYLRDIARGVERRHVGHNPAGGAMIVALLLVVGAQVLTGWLSTTDMFFGSEWLEELHEVMSKVILLLIGLHVLGVAVASWRHRENLPLAMLTGRKRPATGDDIG